jgi:hypothetical protein
MLNNNTTESLTYKSAEPDVNTLRYAYDETINQLEAYFDLCRTSYDERRNYWAGKTRDHRKHGADAFPWEGASDVESHVIDERITRLVSLFVSAVNRANIRAFPVGVKDIARSKVVTNFLKWMVSSGYIPRFKKEMELGANYLLERGILVTYVGWQREDRTFLQQLNLEQMGQISPDLVAAIQAGESDDLVAELMVSAFDIQEGRAKKAIADLRNTGKAEIPLVRRQVNAPEVRTLAPDSDFFFPPYVTDPQKAPYCFWKTYYTLQELENKVSTEGWDADFVEMMITRYRGINVDQIEQDQHGRRNVTTTDDAYEADELVEIIHAYQRLIDPNDNSEAIYETIFHKDFSGNEFAPGYARFEILNGYEDYPVVVTKLSEDSKRLYDTMTIPDLLRGIQNQVKVERDSRIDRNSLATMPPLLHPIGQAPTDWGPGRRIPYRRKDDYVFADAPSYNEGSMEMEQTMLIQADRLVGLDQESEASVVRRQFLVDKFLQHHAEVLKMCYKCFQRFGPDSIFFRVTGAPDPVNFSKGSPDENYDVIINYDVLNTDKEMQETKLQQLVNLTQLDTSGRINMQGLLDAMANAIDPVLADAILQPGKDAEDEVIRNVTDDLAKIFAGIEMPARPTGAQVAMRIIQEYTQQPDVAQRLQTDQVFAQRIQKYMGQYQFQMQQMQNAQIGRIGTKPAQMGGVSTQNISEE